MVTPLDIGLLKNFQIVFPFLFIFCIVYAILSYTKVLGDNKAIQAMIAVVLAFMSLFSDLVVETINISAPWFVLLIIFLVFVMMGIMTLGVKEGDIMSVIKSHEYNFITWWIVALVIIIVAGSLSHALTEKKGGYPPYAPGVNVTDVEETQESEFWKTLFHQLTMKAYKNIWKML